MQFNSAFSDSRTKHSMTFPDGTKRKEETNFEGSTLQRTHQLPWLYAVDFIITSDQVLQKLHFWTDNFQWTWFILKELKYFHLSTQTKSPVVQFPKNWYVPASRLCFHLKYSGFEKPDFVVFLIQCVKLVFYYVKKSWLIFNVWGIYHKYLRNNGNHSYIVVFPMKSWINSRKMFWKNQLATSWIDETIIPCLWNHIH